MPSHRKCFVETTPQSFYKQNDSSPYTGEPFLAHLGEGTGEDEDIKES